METQIQQAVDIAYSGTNDSALKEQALLFINQIKSSPEGWQHCLKLLDSSQEQISPNVKFFVLQLLDDRLPTLTNDETITLNNAVFNYLKNIIMKNKVEEVFLRNALAKTLGLIFVHCTLTTYTDLIKDLLSLSIRGDSFNAIATDYYLRTLLVIHQEIGDQMIARDPSTSEKNGLLKDAIRAKDMIEMTNTWKKIMVHFSSSNNSDKTLSDDIVNNTVLCIGSYVSWIEINLILDQEYMTLLYQFLSESNNNKRRIITANTFNEILHKKMPSVKKLELINFLNLGSILTQLNINSKELDFDVSLALARLTDKIGSELVSLLDTGSEQELANDAFRNLACSKILEILPLIFEFLGNEYDDISLEVFTFIGLFLLFLKKNITIESIDLSSLNNIEILGTLMKNIILKMKFDPEDDGDDDETIEQFNELRSKLNVFLDSIVLLNEGLALEVLINCIEEFLFKSLNNKQSINDWRTVELGLNVLTYYSEMLRNNVMNLPKTMINASRPYFVFNEMLCKVVNNSSDILVSHPLIQLLFFELIMKHYAFFTNGNIQVEGISKEDILLKVLNIFVSNFGVFSENEKVKYRSWYIFYRFIKMTKPRVGDYIIQELIKTLLPLLSFNFEVISNKNSIGSGQDSLQNIELSLIEESDSFENQLYLFESIGLLITFINDNGENIAIFENVLQPLFSNLENFINSISNLNVNMLIQVHHSLIAMGTILKGFDSLQTDDYNEKLAGLLQQISQVVLITLENFIDFSVVREPSEFCIVRLFIILSRFNQASEILQGMLSKFISLIMISFEKLKIQEIINFINFITQLFHYCGQNQGLYLMLSSLLAPFLSKIVYRIEKDNRDACDEFVKRDVLDLQKSFISLLISVSNDHLHSLWLSNEENKSMLVNIVNLMSNYAYNYEQNDFTVVKLALGELNVLCQGVGSGIVVDVNDTYKNDSNLFEQAGELLVSNSILIAIEIGFKVPVANKILLKDAQFRNNVLLEVCRLLKGVAHVGFNVPDANVLMKKSTGKMMNGFTENNSTSSNNVTGKEGYNESNCQQISNVLVSNLGFPVDLANEFVQTLVGNTDRQFSKYLISIVQKV